MGDTDLGGGGVSEETESRGGGEEAGRGFSCSL